MTDSDEAHERTVAEFDAEAQNVADCACLTLCVFMLALLLGCLAAAAHGQDAAPAWVEMRPLGQPPLKDMTLIVDVSGSMQQGSLHRIDQALKAFSEIAGQPVDEGSLRVVAFGSVVRVWPEGRVQLPDAAAVERAGVWLACQSDMQANTDAGTALAVALAADEMPTTVVMVTDGELCWTDCADSWGRRGKGDSMLTLLIDPESSTASGAADFARATETGLYRTGR